MKINAISIVVGLGLLYLVFKNATGSVFLKNQGKVNLVFYGEKARLYTLDNQDVDYIVTYAPESTILVPGGYGEYRVGALNKLVDLEKKPDLFRRAFSAAAGAFVDLYFYPSGVKIFYGEETTDGIAPTLGEVFFSRSNANLLDRLLAFTNLTAQNKHAYKLIEPNIELQGVFYKKVYRKEALNVQIIYTKSYETAVLISKLLDGEGIRVVDLTQNDVGVKSCRLITRKDNFDSKIVQGLKNFFRCELLEGRPPVSDIILKLGGLESDWAVK